MEEAMSTRRKTFSPGFKAKVALEAIREEKTLNELSAKYEVHANVIRGWKKQALENMEAIFEDKRKKKSVDKSSDPDQLYKRIGQMNVENDWLKKKLGLED
jgi:transposase-like protein